MPVHMGNAPLSNVELLSQEKAAGGLGLSLSPSPPCGMNDLPQVCSYVPRLPVLLLAHRAEAPCHEGLPRPSPLYKEECRSERSRLALVLRQSSCAEVTSGKQQRAHPPWVWEFKGEPWQAIQRRLTRNSSMGGAS